MFALPFDIPDADDLRLRELLNYRKLAATKMTEAVLQAHASVKVLEEVEEAIVRGFMRKRRISEGCLVCVAFSDGEAILRYDGFEWNQYRTRMELKLTQRTKSKRWSSRPDMYDLTYLSLMKVAVS